MLPPGAGRLLVPLGDSEMRSQCARNRGPTKRKTDRERGLRTGPRRDPDRETGGEKDRWDGERHTGRDRQIRQTGGCETDKERDSQMGSKRQEEEESDRLEETNIQTDDGEREVRKGVRLLQGRRTERSNGEKRGKGREQTNRLTERTEMDRETEMWHESWRRGPRRSGCKGQSRCPGQHWEQAPA